MDYKLLIPFIIFQAIISIYCWTLIIREPVRFLPKWLWAILSLNTLGSIIYLILGRERD